MKTEPCPECGTWSETTGDGHILVHFDQRRWITEPDCETCKAAHMDRMRKLGAAHAKSLNERMWAEIHKGVEAMEQVTEEPQSVPDIWSKTPPTEPGWYWVCDMNDEPHCLVVGRLSDQKWEFPGVSGLMLVDTVIRLGIQFGPQIPSPIQLLEIETLFATFMNGLHKLTGIGQ